MPSRFAEREIIDRRAHLLTQGRGAFDFVTAGAISTALEAADQPSGQQVPTGKETTIDVECTVMSSDGIQVARLREWFSACRAQAAGYKETGAVMQYSFGDGAPAIAVHIEECWLSSYGIAEVDQDGSGSPLKIPVTLKVFGADVLPPASSI